MGNDYRMANPLDDELYRYLSWREEARLFQYPPNFYAAVHDLQKAYYADLKKYWWRECAVSDWRVVEVALAHGIPAELALSDAVEKKFM